MDRTTWHAVVIILLLVIVVLSAYVAWRFLRLRHPVVVYVPQPDPVASVMQSIHDEAKTAHHRIDRVDGDIQQMQREAYNQRSLLHKIEGWIKFLMHRDIGEELAKQQAEEAEKEKHELDQRRD